MGCYVRKFKFERGTFLAPKPCRTSPPRDPQPPPTSAANTDGPPAQRGEKRKRKRKSNQMLSQQTPDAKHLDANQSPSVEGTLRERNSDDKPRLMGIFRIFFRIFPAVCGPPQRDTCEAP